MLKKPKYYKNKISKDIPDKWSIYLSQIRKLIKVCIRRYHFEIIISNSSTNYDGWNSHGSKACILSILVTEQILFNSLLGELFDSLKPRLLWGHIRYLLFLGLLDCIKASLKAKSRPFSFAKSMFCETLMGKLGFLLKAKTVFEEQILYAVLNSAFCFELVILECWEYYFLDYESDLARIFPLDWSWLLLIFLWVILRGAVLILSKNLCVFLGDKAWLVYIYRP